MGPGLKFVPLVNPTTLHTGDTLPVRRIESGRPLANLSIGVIHEADSRGRLHVARDEPSADTTADAEWVSDFTTLTLNVK